MTAVIPARGTAAEIAPPLGGRRSIAPRAARVVVALALATTVLWMVLTRSHEMARAAALLRHLHWRWLGAAAAAELVSFLTFVSVQRSLLRSGGVTVGLGSITGIALAGNAIDNTLPVGEAWGRIYTFRQFRRRGADAVLAAWTMMAAGFLSGAALMLITAAGVVLTGGQAGSGGVGLAIAGVVTVTTVLALLVRRTGLEAPAVTLGSGVLRGWRRVARHPRDDARQQVEDAWRRLTAVIPTRRAWTSAMGLALLSWLADCVCLTAAFQAVGASAPWPGLVLAYGASQLAACLPVLPGGLGLVEGSLAVGLVAYGGHRSVTVAAVVLYRALSFWILLPIGWGVWAVLARRASSPR